MDHYQQQHQDAPSQPSTSEFRNIEPRTREERQASKSKDLLEKGRIEARAHVHTGRQAVPLSGGAGGPIVPVKASPMYCDDYDRFNRDVAGELHRKKQQELQRKEDVYSTRRAVAYNKQQDKWERELAATDRTEQRYQAQRETGAGGTRRNKSSENYDIITLDYNRTQAGQVLQYKDESVKYKAQVRALTMYGKSTSVTHDIITGAPLKMPLPPPTKPVAPWER